MDRAGIGVVSQQRLEPVDDLEHEKVSDFRCRAAAGRGNAPAERLPMPVEVAFYYLMLIVFVACGAVLALFVASPFGWLK